jgi:PAS domain S-box-containing protein
MSENAIRGLHLSELHPPEESERYKEIFSKLIHERKAITEQLYLVDITGTRIPVEISSNVLDFEGRIIIQCVYRDITERLKAEKSILASEAKYSLLFNNMINGFAYHKVLFDEDNKPIDYVFILVNDAFEVFTGLTRKDVIGNKVTEVIPGIKNAEIDLISIYGEVALTGKSTKLEIYFEPFEKWYSVSAFSHQKGYFATNFDDITNQKMVESDLKEKIKELEEFYDTAVGREIKMKALKEEILKLQSELSQYKK